MHVVVVGGGFGGVKAALELSKRQVAKVTLISNQPYFLHHATLYATATGKSTEESVIPLQTIFTNHPHVKVVEDSITRFDPTRKLVSSKTTDYHYDKLVLALGSVTSFYDIPGLKEHAYGISTLEEVREFHEHIHDQVVTNKLDKEFFVIGGGLTGIELAGALNEYLDSLKELYRLPNTKSHITIVEAKDRIAPQLSKTASAKIAKHLHNQGIKVITNHAVTKLSGKNVTIEGKVHPSTTVVWASGLVNNPFYTKNKAYFSLNEKGYVKVNPYLEALDNVYVIGDNNTVKHSGKAWPAMKQATHVAKNIARSASKQPQLAFRPSSVPIGLPVGEKWGYVEWAGLYVSGMSGAVARRWMELYGYCQLMPYRKALPIWQAHKLTDVDDRL